MTEAGLLEADALALADGTVAFATDEVSRIGITLAGLRMLTMIVKI